MPPSKRTDPITKLMADVALGRHDDRMDDLVTAISSRLLATNGRTLWKVTTPEFTVTVEDCTLDELERMEQLTGVTWHALSPQRSASQCKKVLHALYESRCDMDPDTAAKKAGAFTHAQINGEVVSDYVAIPAPFPSGSSSTS